MCTVIRIPGYTDQVLLNIFKYLYRCVNAKGFYLLLYSIVFNLETVCFHPSIYTCITYLFAELCFNDPWC